jgi:hypothetical protein
VGGRARDVLIILIAFVLVAPACGSDDGPLSASEFARRATGTCARAERRAAALEIPPLDDRGTAGALGRLIDIENGAVRDLRALRPPRRLEARVDEWLATIDQLVVEAEFLRDSLRHGEHTVADAIAVRAARLSLRSQVLAARIGVRGCTMPTPSPVDPGVE